MARIASKIRSQILSGVLVVVPITITVLVLKNIFVYLDNIIRPYLEPSIGFWPPGAGIVISVIIIWLIGLLTSNIIMSRAVGFGEKVLYKIPIAKLIYSAVKQLLETFSHNEKQSFQRAVLVEYPRKDIWSVGFVNGTVQLPGETEKKLNILILAAINPASGFFIIVPESLTIPLDITVEEGMKWVISGGIIKPNELSKKVAVNKQASRSDD